MTGLSQYSIKKLKSVLSIRNGINYELLNKLLDENLLNDTQIANRVNCTKCTVFRARKRRRNKDKVTIKMQLVINFLKDYPQKEINQTKLAAELGINRATISKSIKYLKDKQNEHSYC